MKRCEAITQILQSLTDEVVITSCGMISRETYQIKDRDRNFYLMSAMGSELALGIGLAYTRPDLKVIVISGDSSALMGIGTFALLEKLFLKNIKVYILCNYCHATTGGQPNCADTAFFIELDSPPMVNVIDISNEKGDAPRIKLTPRQIGERFKNAIKE